jgi:hypothetical protein
MTESYGGSSLPQTVAGELPQLEGGHDAASSVKPRALGNGSFTTFFTWRGNGVHQALGPFNHPSITANSRVFVSVSEFQSDARINRFIASARMDVHNVAPFNGGFFAWVEIGWNSPLNARFDVLVDP